MPGKLTDSEIVKALECCVMENHSCIECPYTEFGQCEFLVMKNSLDLINRLQAESKNKTAENEELKSAINGFRGYEDKIKAEAYKDCIEKIKALFPSDNEPYQYWEIHEGADNLLKELVGE